MRHPQRVEDCLRHIAEAIDRARSHVQPLPGIEAFEKNPQVQDAVVRNIEIIGEAVNHINRMMTCGFFAGSGSALNQPCDSQNENHFAWVSCGEYCLGRSMGIGEIGD